MPLSFSFRPTARSLVFLALCSILYFTVVYKQSDIVASIVVAVIATLLIGLLFYCFISARRLSRRMRVTTWFGSDESQSLAPVLLHCNFEQASFTPFFTVWAEPRCLQTTDSPFNLFELSGAKSPETLLQQILHFPHRGTWSISGIRVELRDIFGLSFASWNISSEATIRVHPAPIDLPDWPVLVSSTRVGDTLEHVEHRQGDYLDLKPYHPSDGARRIVWRLFAKTKDLIARQPERSIDPEGECFLFALITIHDDASAYATIAYTEQLQEQDCDVIMSCLGAKGQPFHNDAKEAVISKAFEARQSSLAVEEVQVFLKNIQEAQADRSLVKLIITVGDSLFNSRRYDQTLLEVGEVCDRHGVAPHFLLSTPKSKKDTRRIDANLTQFFRDCADKGWEVSY